MQLLRERIEGYNESMKQDRAREEREERELHTKMEEEEKEKEQMSANDVFNWLMPRIR